jgi:hypothetical protein
MEAEAFRALLDDDGILRADAHFEATASSLLVFAQRSDARIELAAWRARAEGFFGTTIGLTVPKTYRTFPDVDVAQIVVAPGGVRLLYSRPATSADHALAEEAERASEMGGMSRLAERCKQVWLVEKEGSGDKTALLLAAIMASVLLGPIVDGLEIFGVRGARTRLEP